MEKRVRAAVMQPHRSACRSQTAHTKHRNRWAACLSLSRKIKTEDSAMKHYPLFFIPPINFHDWTTSGGGEGSRTPVRKYCHTTFSERRRHILFRAAIA